jgi:stage II sporulation protein AB (anti-sigma F factor)
MSIEFSSLPENVAFARVAAAAFAAQLDFTLNDLDELKVAVSEAVTNSIIHGYKGCKDETVRVEVILYKDALEITVADTGVGIKDIAKAMTPAFSTEPGRMGLGFAFMQSFTDKLEVDSAEGKGTRVKMFKQLISPAVSLPGH